MPTLTPGQRAPELVLPTHPGSQFDLAAEHLDGITYPLASDFWPHGAASRKWGVFREPDGHSERAIFIVDRDGFIRYVDVHDIDNQPDNEVLFQQLELIEPDRLPARRGAGLSQEPKPSAGHASLVMYCTPGCFDCIQARKWLAKHSIEYVEVDISRDLVARDRAAAYNEGRLHTPTFEIGEEVCVDFRPDRLRQLLRLDRDS